MTNDSTKKKATKKSRQTVPCGHCGEIKIVPRWNEGFEKMLVGFSGQDALWAMGREDRCKCCGKTFRTILRNL